VTHGAASDTTPVETPVQSTNKAPAPVDALGNARPTVSTEARKPDAIPREVKRDQASAADDAAYRAHSKYNGKLVGGATVQRGGDAVTYEVHVTYDFGPTGGYHTQQEAAAAARLTQERNVAIAILDGAWRVIRVDTDPRLLNPGGDDFTATPRDVTPIYYPNVDLPIDWDAANKSFSAAVAAYGPPSSPKDPQKLEAAYAHMLALTLGVPDTDIHIAHNAAEAVAGKINFRPDILVDGYSPMSADNQSAKLDPSKAPHDQATPLIEIGPYAFMNMPTSLTETVLHESAHVGQEQRALAIYAQWYALDPRPSDFGKWVANNKSLSATDKAVTNELVNGGAMPTMEAGASLEAFMGSYPTRNTVGKNAADDPFLQLGKYIAPPVGQKTPTPLNDEQLKRIATWYAGLDVDHQRAFKAFLQTPAAQASSLAKLKLD
jgi:hypothetical protein